MTRADRWERHAEIPLLLLALVFLVAYAWPIVDTRLGHQPRADLNTVSWCVWAAFLLDYLIRVALAEDRWRYVARHWYDLPLIALPMLRPLRVLRVLAFARIVNRSATGGLVERVAVYVAGAAVMAVALGALAVLDAEEHAPGSNIRTLGVALWWACETVTTVGYGDHYPITTEGRMIAVVLMVVGIGVVGAVTASVATWMVNHVNRAPSD